MAKPANFAPAESNRAIALQPGELLPTNALDNEKPDVQRLTEASGNEGASFERSYHRAALVIWRRERYAEVLLQAGVAAVLPHLKELIEKADAKGAPSGARTNAVALARLLVNAWKPTPDYSGYGRDRKTENREGMLRLLNRLGEISLLEKFISDVVTPNYDGSENAALVASAKWLDAEEIGELFSELIHRNMGQWHGPCVDLLEAVARKGSTTAEPAFREALRQIAHTAVSKLDEIGKKKVDDEWMDWQRDQKALVVDAAIVAKVLNVLGDLDAPELRSAAAKKLASRPEVFDPVTILVPALGMVGKQDAATKRLWEHSTEFLLARSGHPPVAPTDWRQEVKLSCSCADCRELQAFTLDLAEQTHRFRVRQDRRQHLHQQIERHKLDMTHVTERKGSPQTLVCTKDRRSYKRMCEQYRKDIAALAALAEQADKSPDSNEPALERVKAARSLAANWSPN